MKASLILSIGTNVTQDIINQVTAVHKLQSIDIEIIISICEGDFNLSKARNAGAKRATTDWLIFSDIDTVYPNHTFENMICGSCQQHGNCSINTCVGRGLGDVVAGVTRKDVPDLRLLDEPGDYYQCANSPIAVKRSTFEAVGGYCELYKGWGYEDSDFEHKVENVVNYSSYAKHVLSIHNAVSTGQSWRRGSDHNRSLFDLRLSIPLEERIKQDILVYKGCIHEMNTSNYCNKCGAS